MTGMLKLDESSLRLSAWMHPDMAETVVANGTEPVGRLRAQTWWKGTTQDGVFLTIHRHLWASRHTYVARDGSGNQIATITRFGHRASARWAMALPDGRTFSAGPPEAGAHQCGAEYIEYIDVRLDADTTDEGFWLRRGRSRLNFNPITLITVSEPHAARPWDSVTAEQALAATLVLNAHPTAPKRAFRPLACLREAGRRGTGMH